MCTCFFHIPNQKSKFPFFICFNRDENPLRQTIQLDHWEEDPNVIGGRDAAFKGTWFSVNKLTGNVAFLTNLDDDNIQLDGNKVGMRSRGKVIKDFTATNFYNNYTLESFVNQIIKTSTEYNPFNLILGNLKTMDFHFVDVFHSRSIKLEKGIVMGFSNNLFMFSKWNKVEQGLQKLNSYDTINIDNILKIMEFFDMNIKQEPDNIDEFIFKKPWYNQDKPGLSATISCSILIAENQKVEFYEKTYKYTQLENMKRFILKQNKGLKLKNISKFYKFLKNQKEFQIDEIENKIEFNLFNQISF